MGKHESELILKGTTAHILRLEEYTSGSVNLIKD